MRSEEVLNVGTYVIKRGARWYAHYYSEAAPDDWGWCSTQRGATRFQLTDAEARAIRRTLTDEGRRLVRLVSKRVAKCGLAAALAKAEGR